MILWISFGLLALLWLVAGSKSSRPDGELLKVHPYRRIMLFLMPRRDASTVYFDCPVDAGPLLDYIEQARQHFPCDITHCAVGALAQALNEVPQMNRFVAGHRLYQRRGRMITFSMKRKKMNRAAKISAVKVHIEDSDDFRSLCRKMSQNVTVERSGKKTHTDKELGILNRIPTPLLALVTRVFFWMNAHNFLPGSFIRQDPMFTSIFVANLGSLDMAAGYHHLYEWGSCPLFMMIGKVEERPVVEDGAVVIRKILPLRYTYDERIDDGLNARFGIDATKAVLEDPFNRLGCLEAPATAVPRENTGTPCSRLKDTPDSAA